MKDGYVIIKRNSATDSGRLSICKNRSETSVHFEVDLYVASLSEDLAKIRLTNKYFDIYYDSQGETKLSITLETNKKIAANELINLLKFIQMLSGTSSDTSAKINFSYLEGIEIPLPKSDSLPIKAEYACNLLKKLKILMIELEKFEDPQVSIEELQAQARNIETFHLMLTNPTASSDVVFGAPNNTMPTSDQMATYISYKHGKIADQTITVIFEISGILARIQEQDFQIKSGTAKITTINHKDTAPSAISAEIEDKLRALVAEKSSAHQIITDLPAFDKQPPLPN